MKQFYWGILLCLLSTNYLFGQVQDKDQQDKHTINGYIRDTENGEELIGATVYVKELGTGAVTNAYGFYSITLPTGEYQLVFSFIGYQDSIRSIDLTEDISFNLELVAEALLLEDLVVTGEEEDFNVRELTMSRNSVDPIQLKTLPALFGEPDLLKVVQMQPGVVAAAEGTSGFFVRGGSADQNLILIDEAPVYDPSHFFGLFSIFNADVIKDSELYKGGIPANFGGRLSSILDVRTKDGNSKKLSGTGGIGTMASRFMLEGPIKKNQSSFLLSGRRSYIDLFLMGSDDINKVYFYDLNAKINWRKNNNNRFFMTFYLGRDVQEFNDDGRFSWGNATATLRWNHLFNDRMFSNTSLIFSNFDYGLEIFDPIEGLDWTAGLQEVSIKQDFNYFINPQNQLSFGYHGTFRRFNPGRISPNAENSIFQLTQLDKMYALDHALYVGNEQMINDRLTLQYGLRYSIFQNVGPSTIYTYADPQDNVNIERIDSTTYGRFETIKTFHNLEPRVSARYLLNTNSSLKASYNRMIQNVHLMSNATVSLPFNTWRPSSPYLDPQRSDQIAAGYFRNMQDNTFEFSAELYYKWMRNLTDFADNANVFFNVNLAVEFRTGESDSYGLELYLNKKKGHLTGFVSYTLSRTDRQIETVNLGNVFPANYDRRHNLSVVGSYIFSERWTFGGNFVFNSGRPITLPVGRYEFDNYNLDFYSGRNEYRLPDNHRLDLSATLTPRKNQHRKWKSSWVFAIYNVYNRRNPFTVYTRTKQDDDGNIIGDGTEKEARLVSLFPVLPSVTYNIKF